jgi:hypothetical protein
MYISCMCKDLNPSLTQLETKFLTNAPHIHKMLKFLQPIIMYMCLFHIFLHY